MGISFQDGDDDFARGLFSTQKMTIPYGDFISESLNVRVLLGPKNWHHTMGFSGLECAYTMIKK